ncbi:MAG: hypothetical protein MN733_36500, partial [Nitrososphaera sp.]|nr:hypothetical protein [Nitrososphaera sp.]
MTNKKTIDRKPAAGLVYCHALLALTLFAMVHRLQGASTLPDSVYGEVKKEYRPPNEFETDQPWDTPKKDVDEVVTGKGIPPGELTPDGRIRKGERMREEIYYRSQCSKGTETEIGTSGNCKLYRIFCSTDLIVDIYWLHKPPPEILVYSDIFKRE